MKRQDNLLANSSYDLVSVPLQAGLADELIDDLAESMDSFPDVFEDDKAK